MAEQNNQKAFSFSEKEAEAAARCEVGTGDLPEKTAFWMALAILLSLGVRLIFELPLPPFSMIGIYGAVALVWILFMIYIRSRIKATAKDIAGRTLFLHIEEDGFAVYEFSTELRYCTLNRDITEVEKGEYIYRITSPMGRICLPLREMPAEFRDRLEQLEGAAHSVKSWM